MNILVTGGAGFIGRWVVKRLLEDNHNVWVLDNLSNGSLQNISELINHNPKLVFQYGSIDNVKLLQELFKNHFDICFHLAASINVQESIDDPYKVFNNDVVGSFKILEQCRKSKTKLVYMSTCMVYDKAKSEFGISEDSPTLPASPYSGSKLAGEQLVLSYYHAYGLPVTVLRPFNTYGPYQKTNNEGGVIPIFIKRKLAKKPLLIFGDGKQTRDFLFVTDCADFIVKAGYCKESVGRIINAGSGKDISILELAKKIAGKEVNVEKVPHIHPQSEILRLLSSNTLAKKLLSWKPNITLDNGIELTEQWISYIKS